MTTEPKLIEYRVRPVTRFIVTRYELTQADEAVPQGSGERGEFDNAETAYAVGYALAKADHDRMGWPVGDERIQYPRRPGDDSGDAVVEEVDSQRFSVPVENVLDGAKALGLAEVAVVGFDCDGEIEVFSSLGTPQTLALFASAPRRIAELTEDE